MVLTGHDHGYQRWKPLDANLNPSRGGTTQFVNGAGGHGVQGAVRSDASPGREVRRPRQQLRRHVLQAQPQGRRVPLLQHRRPAAGPGRRPLLRHERHHRALWHPSSLAATTSASGHVALSWNAAWDETGVAGYGIYRDGALIATLGGAETSYVDMNVGLNVTYSYQVDAVDPGGRRSARSNTATITRAQPGDAHLQPDRRHLRAERRGDHQLRHVRVRSRRTPRPTRRASCASACRALPVRSINSATLRVYRQQRPQHRLPGLPAHEQQLDRDRHHLRRQARHWQPDRGTRAATHGIRGHRPTCCRSSPATAELDIALKTTSSTSMSLQQPRGRQPAPTRGQHRRRPVDSYCNPHCYADQHAGSTAHGYANPGPHGHACAADQRPRLRYATNTPTPLPTAAPVTFTFTPVADTYVNSSCSWHQLWHGAEHERQ